LVFVFGSTVTTRYSSAYCDFVFDAGTAFAIGAASLKTFESDDDAKCISKETTITKKENMKPTFETIDQSNERDSFALRAGRRLPLTDCNYHSVALGGYKSNCACTGAPSFLNISRDYFKREAGPSFVAEASVFAMIVLIAAWPVMQAVSALSHFIRATGGV
jgi:hypothetical protein